MINRLQWTFFADPLSALHRYSTCDSVVSLPVICIVVAVCSSSACWVSTNSTTSCSWLARRSRTTSKNCSISSTFSHRRSSGDWCIEFFTVIRTFQANCCINDEVRSRTGQPLLSDTVWSRRLSFLGHLNRADPYQDHYRALQACIADPPADWRRRPGRPRQSWLRTVETDLRPLNLGLATAKRRTQDRAAWRRLVATATSTLTSSCKKKSYYSCAWFTITCILAAKLQPQSLLSCFICRVSLVNSA